MKAEPSERQRAALSLGGLAGSLLGAGVGAARSAAEVIPVIVVALVIDLGLGAIPQELTALASSSAAADGRTLIPSSQTSNPEGAGTLDRGIYFGWLAGPESRFLLSGAPCAGDAHPQVAELYGGDLLPSRVLPRSAVSSFEAPLDAAGRELLVTTLSSTALAGLFAATSASHEVAAATTDDLSFSGLRARCRTWQEIDSDLGSAGALLLPAIQRPAFPPELAARAGPLHDSPLHPTEDEALEAHVLPLPGRTAVLALVLLWNRTSVAVIIDAFHYAPSRAATGRIVAVSGTFDRYDELEARILSPTTSNAPSASLRRSAGALELEIEPGGIALIGIDRGSFAPSRPRAARSAKLVYLGYPVIAYHPLTSAADLQANRRAEPGRAPVAESAKRLAMTSPLYARWSLAGAR